jgi:hypothetical protein
MKVEQSVTADGHCLSCSLAQEEGQLSYFPFARPSLIAKLSEALCPDAASTGQEEGLRHARAISLDRHKSELLQQSRLRRSHIQYLHKSAA